MTHHTDAELLPCPFCGDHAETDFIPEHHSYAIECHSIGCAARVIKETVSDAIKAWNRRAPAAPKAAPISDELPQGFISDVLTAAGLVRHGKQCKALADRLGDAIEKIWTTSISQRKAIAAAPQPPVAAPENIREGAPYDNPAFEQLARDMGVWGTPQTALCAQFWLAAERRPLDRQHIQAMIDQHVGLDSCDATLHDLARAIERAHGIQEQRHAQ